MQPRENFVAEKLSDNKQTYMINQQLLTYIKQQLARTPKEDIKKSLLQNDWNSEDVDEALAELQPVGAPSAPVPAVPVPPSSPKPKIGDNPLFNNQRNLHPRAFWLFFVGRMISWMIAAVWLTFMFAIIIARSSNKKTEIFDASFFVWLAVVLVATTVLSYVVAKLIYRFYKYELTDSEYRAERGIIKKRYVSIPYERIQNIDIYRGLFSRMLGLSNLHIQTAGYGAVGMIGGGSEGVLPGLGVREAELIREELIKRVRGTRQNI